MINLDNRDTMAENIKYYMKINDKSRNDVCKDLNVSYTTFSDWVNGNSYPRIDKIELLANYFHIDKSDLVEKRDFRNIFSYPNVMPLKTKKWRVIGSFACGEPIYANEDFDSYIEAGADIPASFCVRAEGDSMIGARINDGDIVFIRQQPMVENGEIAAVIIDDTVTLKRFYKHGNKVSLVAENPAYEPLVYLDQELEQIHILGKAVAFQSDLR